MSCCTICHHSCSKMAIILLMELNATQGGEYCDMADYEAPSGQELFGCNSSMQHSNMSAVFMTRRTGC